MVETTASRMTDLELVAAMASGKQEALRAFNQRYGNAIAVVAERILASRADAEEVAADVLWQAWRGRLAIRSQPRLGGSVADDAGA